MTRSAEVGVPMNSRSLQSCDEDLVQIRLFDGLRVRLPGKREVQLERDDMVVHLLAILAVYPGRRYSREVLSARLWERHGRCSPSSFANLLARCDKKLGVVLVRDSGVVALDE